MSLFIVVTKEAVNNIQINTHTVASSPFFASCQADTESKVPVTFSSECVNFSLHVPAHLAKLLQLQTCLSSVGVEPLWFDSILSQGSGYFGLMMKFACLTKALNIFLRSSGQSQTHHRIHHRGPLCKLACIKCSRLHMVIITARTPTSFPLLSKLNFPLWPLTERLHMIHLARSLSFP